MRRLRLWFRRFFPLLMLACVVPVRVPSECVQGEAEPGPGDAPATMPTAAVVDVPMVKVECPKEEPEIFTDTPWAAICAKSQPCGIWNVERVCIACVQFWFTINDKLSEWPEQRHLLPFADCGRLQLEAKKTGMADCIAFHEGALQ